jgi:hypothetical protein
MKDIMTDAERRKYVANKTDATFEIARYHSLGLDINTIFKMLQPKYGCTYSRVSFVIRSVLDEECNECYTESIIRKVNGS